MDDRRWTMDRRQEFLSIVYRPSSLLYPYFVERAFTVAPVRFDFNEEFQVDAMTDEAFDVLTGARAYLFNPCATAPDDDLLLRRALDDDGATDARQIGARLVV